ncbi:MAG: hypothetical protein ACTSPY_01165 [Candidatus Helarchaeota archaeon]
MKFKLTDEVIKEIQLEISDLLELEEDKKIDDIGFIIYLRKASCGQMTEGGWKEIACTVEFYENYKKKYNLKTFSDQKIANIPINFEHSAYDLLKDKEIIELEVEGSVIREIKVKGAPMIDLGECRVRLPNDGP